MSTVYTKPVSPTLAKSRTRNLLGLYFGYLFVLQFLGTNAKHNAQWLCLCLACKNTTIKEGVNLIAGHTRSCGCQRIAMLSRAKTRHGKASSSEYSSYLAAKKRCTNPNSSKYPSYGGRGIEFRFDNFEQFYAEVGNKPTPRHSIDRIKNEGHYETGNIRWATNTEQVNNRRVTVRLTYEGRTKTTIEWSQITEIPYGTLTWRHEQGWCDTCVLTNPRHSKRGCPHR